jgi:hypothetical protein
MSHQQKEKKLQTFINNYNNNIHLMATISIRRMNVFLCVIFFWWPIIQYKQNLFISFLTSIIYLLAKLSFPYGISLYWNTFAVFYSYTIQCIVLLLWPVAGFTDANSGYFYLFVEFKLNKYLVDCSLVCKRKKIKVVQCACHFLISKMYTNLNILHFSKIVLCFSLKCTVWLTWL